MAGKREGIRAREHSGGEDILTVPDMPSGIGIAKQLLVTLEEEKAVEKGDRGGDQRHVGRQPSNSASARIVQARYAAGVPILERSPVMLWYKLTIPADN